MTDGRRQKTDVRKQRADDKGKKVRRWEDENKSAYRNPPSNFALPCALNQSFTTSNPTIFYVPFILSPLTFHLLPLSFYLYPFTFDLLPFTFYPTPYTLFSNAVHREPKAFYRQPLTTYRHRYPVKNIFNNLFRHSPAQPLLFFENQSMG